MKTQIFNDSEAVAKAAAQVISAEAREAVKARGVFVMAVSGGRTPWLMLRDLADEDVPWANLHIVQVDERVAPADDPDRNLTHLWKNLVLRVPLPLDQIYVMPVEEKDLENATVCYARLLQRIAGSTPVLDLVHLGLGPDGHTASLVPNDAALEVTKADVALTGIYQNRRRMTLTYPLLNRSRRVVWVVTGADKAEILARLRAGDVSIPAGRIRRDSALIFADEAAVGNIPA